MRSGSMGAERMKIYVTFRNNTLKPLPLKALPWFVVHETFLSSKKAMVRGTRNILDQCLVLK